MNSNATTLDRESLAAAVSNLGEEDLIFLNRLVITRLKDLEQAKDSAQVSLFTLADRVEFTTNDGAVDFHAELTRNFHLKLTHPLA